MMAAGVLYLVNSRSFREGREKAILQQNVAWCMEAISRDVRQAARAGIPSGSRLVLKDADGSTLAEWKLETLNGEPRIKRGNQVMAPEDCSLLGFSAANADTSTVSVTLELEDGAQNKVRLQSRITLRNHDAGGS